MRKLLCLSSIFLLIFFSPARAQDIGVGTYNSFFADGVFSIKPPAGFTDFKRDPKGATFFDHQRHISFSVHHTYYPEMADKTNEEILHRFEGNEFKKGFIRGFNSISDREIMDYKITQVAKREVLKFTAVDSKNKINPISGIIYYKDGTEFKITIGAATLNDLENNHMLFEEVIYLLE